MLILCQRKCDAGFSGSFQTSPKGGKLAFYDVCFDIPKMLQQLKKNHFSVSHMEDLTEQWKQYYLEALWKEVEVPCRPKGRHCSYALLACERM